MKITSITVILLAITILTGPVFPVYAANKTTAATEFFTPTESEARVREYFKDTPVMIEIARCESKFRQYTDGGTVLRSAGMIGVFQFFESIHSTGALALGFDLATLEGNLGYAEHVYKTQGTTPWSGSSYCWDTTPAKTAMSAAQKERLMQQITLLTKLITLLQKQLAIQQAAIK